MHFGFLFCFSLFHFSYFILLSQSTKFLKFSIYGINNCQDSEQYVGAGINTLMTFCDGLGPSIFCQKMQETASIPFRQSQYFDFDIVICKVLFPICTLTWRVNNYVSRQEKV